MAIFSYANKTFTFSGKITIYKVSELRNKMIEAYNTEANKEGDFFLIYLPLKVLMPQFYKF